MEREGGAATLRFFVLATWLVAGSVLVGWIINHAVLKSVIPGLVAMNPLTAICFILSALALHWAGKGKARASRTAALAVGILGLWCFAAHLYHLPLRPDTWLFSAQLEQESVPNRMAVNTALAFVVFSAAVLSLRANWKPWILPIQAISGISGSLGFITVMGYAFAIGEWPQFGTSLPMAVHTGALFILLTCGAFALRPEEGLLRPLAGRSPSSVLGRRLLAVAAVTPMCSGLAAVIGEDSGAIPRELGGAVAVLATLAIMCGMIWHVVYRLRKAEDELQDAHDELERRVSQRTAELAASNDKLAAEAEERKKLNEQLMHSQKMEGIGRLAGGIAHDFNNLLTGIMGYSELAQARLPVDSPVQSDLKQVVSATESAASLTRQLLTFARRQVTEPQVIKLAEITEGITPMLKRVIGADIELTVQSSEDEWNVLADKVQIEQVLMNLVVNAKDAMPEGGKIIVETHNVSLDEGIPSSTLGPGEYVLLSVTDDGHGMDSETASHIFEPFFTTKDKGKGTGLGLPTCYGIISQAGGHIWVYSEPGHGTTFKIYLPRSMAQNQAIPIAAEPTRLRNKGETILLVEDEPMVRALSVESLRSRGYQVVFASNGREAMEWVAKYDGPLDLLITDVVMPEMGGRELCERLKKVRPDTNVLFVSGYTDDAIVHHGILESGLAFLQKPYSPSKLAAKVHEVLETAKQAA